MVITWLNANAGAVTALATLALAIVTGVFVAITKSAAERQEKAARRQAALSEAELFRNLLSEYSQPGMSDALIYLERWWRDQGDGASLTSAARGWAERFNNEHMTPESPDATLNDARRVVALFHRKLLVFVEQGYFSAGLKREVKALGSKRLVLGVLRELELAHAEAQHRGGGLDEAKDVYDRMERTFSDP